MRVNDQPLLLHADHPPCACPRNFLQHYALTCSRLRGLACVGLGSKHFIDPDAKFAFAADPQEHAGAVRFDMFEGEFTHAGDECTFEVLVNRFGLRQKRLRQIAQLVHDADLEDNKFGRPEGRAIDLITKGWARMDWSDEKILRHGFDLFDALYLTLGS